MPYRPCLDSDCPALVRPPAKRCPPHAAKHRARQPRVHNRYAQKKARREEMARAPFCARCLRTEADLRPDESLELHHRNGDPTDNRQENRLMLCPDCHHAEHR